jgi:hypothetical protein
MPSPGKMAMDQVCGAAAWLTAVLGLSESEWDVISFIRSDRIEIHEIKLRVNFIGESAT